MDTSPTDERARPAAEADRPRRSHRRAWALALAAVIAVVALVGLMATRSRGSGDGGASGVTPTQLVGHRLPDLAYVSFDGTRSTLGALTGRPVVLNFWSATCVACRTEMPALQRIHRADGDQVTFLGIDSGDGLTTGRDAARQSGVAYPLAFDPTSGLATRLGALALPTTVVVNRQGVVTHVHVGAVDPSDLEAWIAQVRP
jgi:cytochrome c biogenesis protein CcmG, thiol:disulfide interchange protein DsbE